MSFANIFSHSIGCLLVLLIVSFAVQKLFIFLRSQWFIFAFNSLAFGDVSSKKLLQLRSERFFPAFSSRVLMVSCLTVRSFIHFEFIFVNGVRKWSSFNLLHVAVQFSQHHLLKRLSFFHWIFFPALSKISWPYVCGSSSVVSILFHWSMYLFL
uniref:Secreted protein n=1 Tax=Felis catus TaxID=9685 RepID=A0ABI7XMZ9_FELCA